MTNNTNMSEQRHNSGTKTLRRDDILLLWRYKSHTIVVYEERLRPRVSGWPVEEASTADTVMKIISSIILPPPHHCFLKSYRTQKDDKFSFWTHEGKQRKNNKCYYLKSFSPPVKLNFNVRPRHKAGTALGRTHRRRTCSLRIFYPTCTGFINMRVRRSIIFAQNAVFEWTLKKVSRNTVVAVWTCSTTV